MSEEEREITERLVNALEVRNLADRLNSVMVGPSNPLKLESNASAQDKCADEPPKQ
jgi:hypothetical protein